MRVLKDHNVAVTPFYLSVEDIGLNTLVQQEEPDPDETKSENMLEKYAYLFQTMISFEREVDTATTLDELFDCFKQAVRRLIPVKEASLLMFDENKLSLKPVENGGNTSISRIINSYYHEGVLRPLFENRRPVVVPRFGGEDEDNGQKMNFLLMPVYEESEKKGVLAVLTPIESGLFHESDRQFLQILLRVLLSKVSTLTVRRRLNSIYEELQTYQAKLSNDFRLAAIGELTEGIVEELVSPLQVIMTTVDMMEVDEEDLPEIKRIRSQVKKMNSVINRVVKFASINQKDVKIESCNLNDIIRDYHSLVKTSLQNLKLELVLDFDESIPPILSHPNYIHQILANIFGLIRTLKKNEVGILLQTRYQQEQVKVKFISTVDMSAFTSKIKASNLTVNIIENLMKKHEGFLKIESFKESGSQITLNFPLKRKIRS